MTLASAVGSLKNISQWFVWRLVWDDEANKYQKTPATPEGPWIIDASKPANWLPYGDAVMRVYHMQQAEPANRFALGFWLTAECGYWFLDLDKCITPEREYTPIASTLVGQLPGCFFEFSSSGTGCHVIGRGDVPAHSMRNKAHGLELYTEQRGIAFGLTGEAWGDADTVAPAIAAIAAEYFPPRVGGAAGQWDAPRADWAGPVDDEVLIAKMLASASSASRMGHRASFAQLWNASDELEKFYGPDSGSERDAALAAHLAFWTGCDAPRMERLMRRSALARPKWDEHRTYLRELTIEGACARQGDVYAERAAVPVAAMYAFAPALPALPVLPLPSVSTVMVSAEAKATIDKLLDMVSSSTSWEDMHNRVIPAIRAEGVPSVLMSRLENAVNKRLDLWDAKLSVAKLRALLKPVSLTSDSEPVATVPEWLKRYVYVRQSDKFHDMNSGVSVSRTSFNGTHNRDMPLKGDGPLREDAAQWALDRWNIQLVHDVIYWPGKPAILEYGSLPWANSYTEGSHPPLQDYTADGVAAIDIFMKHLLLLCNGREEVRANLVYFLAHNVQRPGIKIRWCPVIKGAQGIGKSLIGEVMNAAMGERNVAFLGPETVANSGGFTDWAHGTALVTFEELYFAGKERHKIANSIKPYISNNKITVNGKGDKPRTVPNTCNQIAFTNHGGSVPLEDGERRWFVIFSHFETISDFYKAIGVADKAEAKRVHFGPMWASLAREPGQWRKWLLELPIPASFDIDAAAMETKEKAQMRSAGRDEITNIAYMVLEEGAPGVATNVVSSSMFYQAVEMRMMRELGGIGSNKDWRNHLLEKLGFIPTNPPATWWNGKTHRTFVKPGADDSAEAIRTALSVTL